MLKVALILESKHVHRHLYELAKWGQNNEKISISHMVCQVSPHSGGSKFKSVLNALRRDGIFNTLNRIAWRVLEIIDGITLMPTRNYKDHNVKYDISDLGLAKIEVHAVPTAPDSVCRYASSDIEAIKNLNLDILINCGNTALKGSILTAAKLGVISLRLTDRPTSGGEPPAFWEVYNKEIATGFVIEKLDKKIDDKKELLKGSIETKHSFSLNLAAVNLKAYFFLKKLLVEIEEKQSLPNESTSQPYCGRVYKMPNFFTQCRYGLGLANALLVKAVRKYCFGKSVKWNVAFQECSDWKKTILCQASVIPNPPARFLADPFVIRVGERVCCFVEDYEYKMNRACISAYELSHAKYVRLGKVIVEPFHMSFPYLFNYNNKLFMCPETSENRDIRIYECIDFPKKWRFVMSIMRDVRAVDSMIFLHGGTWWLMTNIDSTNMDSFSELHIFSAESPLTNKWVPHAKNPVIFDAKVARNGGMIRDKDSLYRVYQSRGFDLYGKYCGIRRIATLTGSDYVEEGSAVIKPDFFTDAEGTHHFHYNDDYCVFDFFNFSTRK